MYLPPIFGFACLGGGVVFCVEILGNCLLVVKIVDLDLGFSCLGFCYGVVGFVFVVCVLYVINVIKVRPSAGWVLCYVSLFMILCMVCGPSAGCLCSLLFNYNPVTFSPCLKILQACNVLSSPH